MLSHALLCQQYTTADSIIVINSLISNFRNLRIDLKDIKSNHDGEHYVVMINCLSSGKMKLSFLFLFIVLFGGKEVDAGLRKGA